MLAAHCTWFRSISLGAHISESHSGDLKDENPSCGAKLPFVPNARAPGVRD